MRKTIITLCIAALLGGCNTPDVQQVADDAEAAASLVQLRDTYDQVRATLDAHIDQLPTELGLDLLELEEDADALRERIETAWRDGITAPELDALYLQGVQLWQRGHTVIDPVVDQLPPYLLGPLRRLDTQALAIERLYRRIQAGDAQTRELLRAGLELATQVLRIGLVVASK